jgi:prolyl-tRNA synthetase
MKYSKLLGKTIREDPHGSTRESYSLLIKGGYIRQMGHGLFSFLPLGVRVLKNLQNLISEEVEKLGGQEVNVPLVSSADIWHKSGRDQWVGKEMIHFIDRHGRELVLSPTHEETMVELIRSSMSSYRDLPLLIYQFQIKFRDEERTREGLARTKEFLMYDSYSFHRSGNDLNNFFPRVFTAFDKIFKRCNIETIAAEAGVGFIGGEKSFEFLMPSGYGDNVVVLCKKGHYRANRDIAVGSKKHMGGDPLAMEKVETRCCVTMDKLSKYLNIDKHRLAKSVVYFTPVGLVMAVVPGDFEVGKEKLSRYLNTPVLRLATNEELASAGLVPGYLSPVGNTDNIRVIADDIVVKSANLVFGANEENFHFINVNHGRDYEIAEITDISLTNKQSSCLFCGAPLQEVPAIEVGHIFKLGDHYSRVMNLVFHDDKDRISFPHMGCYGIGLGRLMDAIVEANHDDRGIIWPPHLAPFQVFLMAIGKSLSVKKLVEELHEELGQIALYDDREDSPGVKFKDADLIGIPLRLVVSARHMSEGMVEIQERRSGKITLVPQEKIKETLDSLIGKE